MLAPLQTMFERPPESMVIEDDSDDDDSDVFSMTSGSVALTRASSVTSADWEMRSASPAPSVFSMTSSMRQAAYRHEYGRALNNYSELYSLPADEEELERLDKQHIMFMEVMGKYPPPLPAIMADDTPGEPKACADLGCGSGSWILDIARDFPSCSAVGIDLVPMQVLDMPSNCRSEIDDLNLGLQHFFGDFNVVHTRLICSGIRDYSGLVDQIAMTLRPGGLIDLTEFDFRVYGLDHQPILVDLNDPSISAVAKWMALAHEAVKHRGGEPEAANHLYEWVSANPHFENVRYRCWWFQTSNWNQGNDPESRRQNRYGAAMRDDILSFLRSCRPLLLSTGFAESVVDEMEDNARSELLEGRVPGYIRVENTYACKVQS